MSGDCAAIGWWSANAVSAAGYLLAAGTLAWGTIAGRLPRHSLVLAAAVALEGAGSILAHGAGGDGAILVHDLALLAMVGYVAGWHLGRLGGRALAGAVAGAVSATLVGAAAWPWYRGAGSLVATLALATIAVSEVVARRRGAPAVWTGPLLAVAGRRRPRLVRRAHRQPAVRSGIAAAAPRRVAPAHRLPGGRLGLPSGRHRRRLRSGVVSCGRRGCGASASTPPAGTSRRAARRPRPSRRRRR